jgi:hypothetical protein
VRDQRTENRDGQRATELATGMVAAKAALRNESSWRVSGIPARPLRDSSVVPGFPDTERLRDLRGGVLDVAQIIRCEFDGNRADVLLQVDLSVATEFNRSWHFVPTGSIGGKECL